MPADPSFSTFEMKCNFHPGDSSDSAALSEMADGVVYAAGTATASNRAQAYTCNGSNPTCSGTALNNCDKASNLMEVISRGDLRDHTGGLISAGTSSTIPDNFVWFRIRCSDSSGAGGRWAWGLAIPGLIGTSAGWTRQGSNNNTCGLPTTDGGGWDTGNRTAVCYQTTTEAWSAAYPDYWEGQEPTPTACEGVTVDFIRNGESETFPLDGTGNRGDTVQLKVTFPSTGDEQTVELIFMPDLSAAWGRRTLGTFTYPASGLGVRQWNLTSSFLESPEPTFDMEAIRIRCSNNYGEVIYWKGDSDSFDDGASTPLDQLPPQEGSCYTDALDGMQLDSPVTWVTGIGRMGVCLLRYLFVPDGEEVADTFAELRAELEVQFPFSVGFLLIEFAYDLGNELEDPTGTGCFDMPSSFDFGSFSVPMSDVCIGDEVEPGSTTRNLLAALMIAPMLWAICGHALRVMRGVSTSDN